MPYICQSVINKLNNILSLLSNKSSTSFIIYMATLNSLMRGVYVSKKEGKKRKSNYVIRIFLHIKDIHLNMRLQSRCALSLFFYQKLLLCGEKEFAKYLIKTKSST